jgi:hypothetical protein
MLSEKSGLQSLHCACRKGRVGSSISVGLQRQGEIGQEKLGKLRLKAKSMSLFST